MPIILTPSKTNPNTTVSRLAAFTQNPPALYAQAIYDNGYTDADGFHRQSSTTVEWGGGSPDALSYADLEKDVTQVAELPKAMETYAVTLDLYKGIVP